MLPQLVAAISHAGGLGTLQGTWLTPDGTGEAVRSTRALTDRAFGINLVIDERRDEQLAPVLAAGVKMVSFFWGDPSHTSIVSMLRVRSPTNGRSPAATCAAR